MVKVILVIITVIIICLALFLLIKNPTTKLESPISQGLGKILGFSNNTQTGNNTNDSKTNNPLTQTKDSLGKNAQKSIESGIESVKTLVYNEARTTLDNVFEKQADSDKAVTVNVLGVVTDVDNQQEFIIDLSRDSDLKLTLAVNNKYYLKFQNIPPNYCLYINGDKYPITEDLIEIQFSKSGNYPIKANSCDLNDKNIGSLIVR